MGEKDASEKDDFGSDSDQLEYDYASAEQFWERFEMRRHETDRRRHVLNSARREMVFGGIERERDDAEKENMNYSSENGAGNQQKQALRTRKSERRHQQSETSQSGKDFSHSLFEHHMFGSDLPKLSRSRSLKLHAWLLKLATLREELLNRLSHIEEVKREIADRKLVEVSQTLVV